MCTMHQFIQSTWRFRKALAQMLTHSGDKSHSCVQCSKSFNRAYILKCDQCNFASHLKDSLTKHKMTHSGEKHHRCSQCGFSSITTSQLTINMRSVHTGEKPYKCGKCVHSFCKATQDPTERRKLSFAIIAAKHLNMKRA